MVFLPGAQAVMANAHNVFQPVQPLKVLKGPQTIPKHFLSIYSKHAHCVRNKGSNSGQPRNMELT